MTPSVFIVSLNHRSERILSGWLKYGRLNKIKDNLTIKIGVTEIWETDNCQGQFEFDICLTSHHKYGIYQRIVPLIMKTIFATFVMSNLYASKAKAYNQFVYMSVLFEPAIKILNCLFHSIADKGCLANTSGSYHISE